MISTQDPRRSGAEIAHRLGQHTGRAAQGTAAWIPFRFRQTGTLADAFGQSGTPRRSLDFLRPSRRHLLFTIAGQMKRTAVNFFVDAAAFAAFVLLTATGLIERYLLPPGTGRFRALWGMNRHEWGEVHFWIAVVVAAVLALHLVLHWKWIVGVLRGRSPEGSGWRVALGVVGLIALLGLSAAPFLAESQQTGTRGPPQPDDGQGRARQRSSWDRGELPPNEPSGADDAEQ